MPEAFPSIAPGEVIVVFDAPTNDDIETAEWMKLQEGAFAKAWDDEEESVYAAL